MIRSLTIYIGLFLFFSPTAWAAEYALPFQRAQAWADFFVVELNNEVLKIGIDGEFSSSNYKLPLQVGCQIIALNYRPIVPMGQLLLTYEAHCGRQSIVTAVKLNKVGTSVQQIFTLPYGESDMGAGLWVDEKIVITAKGTLLVLNHETEVLEFFATDLVQSFKAVHFKKIQATDAGFRATYDTGVPHQPRQQLCLDWPSQKLRSCQ